MYSVQKIGEIIRWIMFSASVYVFADKDIQLSDNFSLLKC